MMKKYIWCVTVVALILSLSACKKENGTRTVPVYTQYTFPASVKVTFPKSTIKEGDKEKTVQLPDLSFNIDNRAMRVWNKVPLPFESKYDSIDISIAVTSEAVVQILNERTQKVTVYQANRKAQRIDATGGKLKVSVAIENKPKLTYDLRILTYGYDPDKFTWSMNSGTLPIEAEEAKVIKHRDNDYWIARLQDGTSELYQLDINSCTFTKVADAVLPQGLIASNVLVDKSNKVWGITQSGELYSSNDLKMWQTHTQGNATLTQLVGEATIMDGTTKLLAIGHPTNSDIYYTYYTYTISANGVEQVGSLPKQFPVKEAYTYTHTQDGVSATTIYSGMTADDQPAHKNYFLSGSIQWGETPYQGESSQLPYSGGLFLHTGKDTELFVVGGMYEDGKPSNTIKRSVDKGVTWTTLPNQTVAEGTFGPRHHASGVALGYDKSLQIFIFGGMIDNQPSKEIWLGHLDTTGGIINSFE